MYMVHVPCDTSIWNNTRLEIGFMELGEERLHGIGHKLPEGGGETSYLSLLLERIISSETINYHRLCQVQHTMAEKCQPKIAYARIMRGRWHCLMHV